MSLLEEQEGRRDNGSSQVEGCCTRLYENIIVKIRTYYAYDY